MDIFIVFVLVFLGVAILRVPIGYSMGIGATIAIIYSGSKLGIVAPAALSALDAFPFLAIPAFIYAGDLMAHGGISRALIDFIQLLFGRIKGSLGAVTVLASTVFGSVTGSAVATVSAIGSITIPEMVKNGYKREYATALTSASGFIGILIPPSVPGIMYAISTGTSIADIWIATVIPGILVAGAFILYNYFSSKNLVPAQDMTFTRAKLTSASPKFLIAILMPVIIFVGIYGGIFTPTEAGAVAVVFGIFAGWFFKRVFKNQSQSSFWNVTSQSAVNSASIAIMIAFAGIAGKIITLSAVPNKFAQFILDTTDSKIVFLIMVNILLLILGMLMEPNTIILILAPMLAPAAQAMGIDIVQLGGIMVLNLGIGMITPPFAGTLFVGCKIADVTFDRLIKPVIPFILVTIPVLILTTFWEPITLYLIK